MTIFGFFMITLIISADRLCVVIFILGTFTVEFRYCFIFRQCILSIYASFRDIYSRSLSCCIISSPSGLLWFSHIVLNDSSIALCRIRPMESLRLQLLTLFCLFYDKLPAGRRTRNSGWRMPWLCGKREASRLLPCRFCASPATMRVLRSRARILPLWPACLASRCGNTFRKTDRPTCWDAGRALRRGCRRQDMSRVTSSADRVESFSSSFASAFGAGFVRGMSCKKRESWSQWRRCRPLRENSSSFASRHASMHGPPLSQSGCRQYLFHVHIPEPTSGSCPFSGDVLSVSSTLIVVIVVPIHEFRLFRDFRRRARELRLPDHSSLRFASKPEIHV